MKRIEKYKNGRKKSYWIGIAIILSMVFIIAFNLTIAFLISRENKQVKEFILNYDKTKQVYNLQQDYNKIF